MHKTISVGAVLAAAATLSIPTSLAAQSLTCADHETYVICDNGRTYTLPGVVVAPPSPGGLVVVPQRRQPVTIGPVTIGKDEERELRKILRGFERAAWRECLSIGSAGSGERTLCQRRELRRQVDASKDRQLKHYFETQWRFR